MSSTIRSSILTVRRHLACERGFSLIELVVAMTIISGAFLAFTYEMAGGMSALSAARQRSVFVELANGEMEELRSFAWDSLGVSNVDPNRAAAYPADAYEGRPAVVLDSAALLAADPTFVTPLAAVSTITSSPVRGVITPYTIRRWVTWSEVAGTAGSTEIKRIDVVMEWSESGRAMRSVALQSIRYPGGLGPKNLTNHAPVATASATPTSGQAPLAVSFTGSGSTDPDGDTLTHAWQFGATGATSTVANPSYTYTAAGTYNAVLTVTDPSGATSSSSVSITVTAPPAANLPPTASFTVNPTNGVAPLNVNFDGAASSDPEGGPLTYSWSYGDGTANGTGVSATHVFNAAGTFTVMLTVTDNAGLTGTASTTISTTPLNCAITSASFKNPSTNTLTNDVKVDSSNKPSSSSFTFTATSNTACTAITASIPQSSGSFSVVLGYTDVGSTRTWTGTASVGSSVKFTRASNQSGSFTSSTGQSFPITFSVHT